jgi:hypothetical protein
VTRLAASLRRDLAALDRRGFLRLAGIAAASGLVPGCADAPEDQPVPVDLALEHLSPRGYTVLNAASARFAGPQGAALVRAGALDPGRAADRFLSESPDLAGPVEQALWVLEFGVWPLLGKLRPFTALDDPARDAVLRELMTSRLALKRVAFNGLRSLGLLAFYGALSEHRPPGVTLGAIPAGVTPAHAVAE